MQFSKDLYKEILIITNLNKVYEITNEQSYTLMNERAVKLKESDSTIIFN